MSMQEHFTTTRDNLFAASQIMPVDADKLTIAEGATLKRGSLVTSAGALCDTGDDVYAVLAEDVDTTDAAKDAAVYLTGDFNENALIVAEGATVASFKVSARKVCIFIKPTIPY